MRKFLTAQWADLVMVNYEVDRDLLSGCVPAGTELDLHEGRCFVSLVGFMFLDTRVLGFLVPFHVSFEEINLRYYVKRTVGDEVRRGVVFIKEIVPRWAIAAVARTVYGEPYESWITHNRRDSSVVSYEWRKGPVDNRLSVTRGDELGVPRDNSHGSFIIEHYWGYTDRGAGRTDEYRVEHPKWVLQEAKDPVVNVDFEQTYGPRFGFLSSQMPFSVLLAEGSEIAVFRAGRIT